MSNPKIESLKADLANTDNPHKREEIKLEIAKEVKAEIARQKGWAEREQGKVMAMARIGVEEIYNEPFAPVFQHVAGNEIWDFAAWAGR